MNLHERAVVLNYGEQLIQNFLNLKRIEELELKINLEQLVTLKNW